MLNFKLNSYNLIYFCVQMCAYFNDMCFNATCHVGRKSLRLLTRYRGDEMDVLTTSGPGGGELGVFWREESVSQAGKFSLSCWENLYYLSFIYFVLNKFICSFYFILFLILLLAYICVY